MKTTLTIEQSSQLIEMGIDPRIASCGLYAVTDEMRGGYELPQLLPAFTLTDLLSILPKGICHEGLWIKLRITTWIDEPWFAGYQNQVGVYVTPNKTPFNAPELIDALNSLLVWAIGEGYVKTNKDK